MEEKTNRLYSIPLLQLEYVMVIIYTRYKIHAVKQSLRMTEVLLPSELLVAAWT